MTPLEEALRLAVELLRDTGLRFALVGGLAVSAHTEPRVTRDVDLAVAVADDAQAEELVRAFLARGFELTALLEHELTARLVTSRLLAPLPEPTIVDLLFSSSGIEAEVAAEAEPSRPFPNLSVPVSRVGHLMAMKVLAQGPDRPADLVDLTSLRKVCTEEEAARARQACVLIMERGYHRGRDLLAELEPWLSRS